MVVVAGHVDDVFPAAMGPGAIDRRMGDPVVDVSPLHIGVTMGNEGPLDVAGPPCGVRHDDVAARPHDFDPPHATRFVMDDGPAGGADLADCARGCPVDLPTMRWAHHFPLRNVPPGGTDLNALGLSGHVRARRFRPSRAARAGLWLAMAGDRGCGMRGARRRSCRSCPRMPWGCLTGRDGVPRVPGACAIIAARHRSGRRCPRTPWSGLTRSDRVDWVAGRGRCAGCARPSWGRRVSLGRSPGRSIRRLPRLGWRSSRSGRRLSWRCRPGCRLDRLCGRGRFRRPFRGRRRPGRWSRGRGLRCRGGMRGLSLLGLVLLFFLFFVFSLESPCRESHEGNQHDPSARQEKVRAHVQRRFSG